MTRTSQLATLMLVLGVLIVYSQEVQAQEKYAPKIEVGKPFPDMAFPMLSDGSLKSVADFRGKKTIVHVFASW